MAPAQAPTLLDISFYPSPMKILVNTYAINITVSFQVRYKLAPLIWKRLYKERARYTGGANAITLLLGRGSMLPWPSSMTLVMVIALGACVHTVMLSRYLISSTSTSTAVR